MSQIMATLIVIAILAYASLLIATITINQKVSDLERVVEEQAVTIKYLNWQVENLHVICTKNNNSHE